jgi:hypothetical protein
VDAFYKLQMDTRLNLSKEVLGGSWDALLTRRADLVVGAAGEPPQIPTWSPNRSARCVICSWWRRSIRSPRCRGR